MPISIIRRTTVCCRVEKGYGANSTPDFTAVGAYDGMAAIVHAAQATKGKMDGDAAVKSLLGWKFDSPQGPIMVDPETRDIVMNEYLAEVVKGPDGSFHQKVIGQIDRVKDMQSAGHRSLCSEEMMDAARAPFAMEAVPPIRGTAW